jgi:hypothetical protein
LQHLPSVQSVAQHSLVIEQSPPLSVQFPALDSAAISSQAIATSEGNTRTATGFHVMREGSHKTIVNGN